MCNWASSRCSEAVCPLLLLEGSGAELRLPLIRAEMRDGELLVVVAAAAGPGRPRAVCTDRRNRSRFEPGGTINGKNWEERRGGSGGAVERGVVRWSSGRGCEIWETAVVLVTPSSGLGVVVAVVVAVLLMGVLGGVVVVVVVLRGRVETIG